MISIEMRKKRIIKEAWIDFARQHKIDPQFGTMGDFRKFIKLVNSHRRSKKGEEAIKDVLTGALSDLIPGSGTVMSIAKGLHSMYKAPDDRKTDTDLDLLNIDDDVSKIVDDTIEDKFFDKILDRFESLPDDAPIPNMTKALSDYIADDYNDRTVMGFDESRSRKKMMRLTESQLRRYVRKFLKESTSIKLDRGTQLNTGMGIPPEDFEIINLLKNQLHYGDLMMDVTPDRWSITLFRGEKDICNLQHDFKTDTWAGCGPSAGECDMTGGHQLGAGAEGREEAMDFAQNFGTEEGKIGRGISKVKDFFSLGGAGDVMYDKYIGPFERNS